MAKPVLLIGDIGGTNARFALANPSTPGFSSVETLNCDDYPSSDEAIRRYLEQAEVGDPDAICLAAAGPISDQVVRFTNNHWSLDVAELKSAFGTTAVQLLNDFEAIAYSIPFIDVQDYLPIGWPEKFDLDPGDIGIGVLGPGTGLGAVGLLRRDGKLYPVVGEAGHEGFAPETQLQIEVLSVLRDRFDRVSAERLLSGPGVENLHWALTKLHGDKSAKLTAAEIFSRGSGNADVRAAETVQLFFEILGQVAGNLALSLGAWDGVFIAGGIARRYPEIMVNSHFRVGFERKGRHRTLMEAVPTLLVTYEQPGLLGASYCALELFEQVAGTATPA